MSIPSRSLLRAWPARAAAVSALVVGVAGLTLLPGGSTPAAAAGLVPWADCDALLGHYRTELARTATPYGVGSGGLTFATTDMRLESSTAATAGAGGGATGGAVGTGPTGTNVQEAGVDEPDTAKLHGELLLASAGGRLQVLRAGPQPELLSTLPLGDGTSQAELLVDGDRVLAVVPGWRGVTEAWGGPVPALPVPAPPVPAPQPEPVPGAPEPALPPVEDVVPVAPAVPPAGAGGGSGASIALAPGEQVVRLVLIDLTDPAAPTVLEQLELDGRYVSARLVGGTVRVVTTSSPRLPSTGPAEPYGPAQEEESLAANREAAESVGVEEVLPRAVRLGPDGEELSSGPAVDCAGVQHAGSAAGASTLLVTTLRPSTGLTALDSTGVTTDGDLVYASADRLYVATSRWGTVAPADGRDIAPAPDDVTTEVHAFDTTAAGRTPYVGSGSVTGFVHGRWALSEHEGLLRVATTQQPPWNSAETSSSSVVVLAEEGTRLVERGRLDGLGPDERIYAVRYFGDVATVVTFRETDPLYVLDLADPGDPRLLGELKIPGFSTYLHPVGDDRLLAVGQDADSTGRTLGVQVSLFDLSDLSDPVKVDRLSLGEGHTAAGDDSRAFGYDPQRRLAAMPFSRWDERTGISEYSALAVRVTEDFRLEEAGRLDVGRQVAVERVLLAGDLAYAVTSGGVVAVDAASFAPTGRVAFEGLPPAPVDVPLPEPLPEGPAVTPLPDQPGSDGSVPILPAEPLGPDCSVSSDGATSCPDGGSGAGSSGSSGSSGAVEPGSAGTG
ncbi:MAG TPA: beta-propeller domain-containing protein [Mycobacteriales bacterium]|nr:beta-propeller domain-containing protein [Mycobacteriales bacterium]